MLKTASTSGLRGGGPFSLKTNTRCDMHNDCYRPILASFTVSRRTGTGGAMPELAPYHPSPVVLIVENDVLERLSKAATLRRQGLQVFEAADIKEAMAVLNKIAVDVLVSNVSLIDGTVLAQWVHESQPTTQVVWTMPRPSGQNHVRTAVLH
jgi:hypothetical protein